MPERDYNFYFNFLIGDKSEIWFGIVTWLLEHNAKKFVFIEDEKNDFDNQYQKRFSLFLQNYPDLYVMHMSASTIKHKDDAATMIRDVHNFAKLDVVFCLSLVQKNSQLDRKLVHT